MRKRRLRARRSRILTMHIVFRLDIGLKFARSDFGKPGFFSRGEISRASLNLDEEVIMRTRFIFQTNNTKYVHTFKYHRREKSVTR